MQCQRLTGCSLLAHFEGPRALPWTIAVLTPPKPLSPERPVYPKTVRGVQPIELSRLPIEQARHLPMWDLHMAANVVVATSSKRKDPT